MSVLVDVPTSSCVANVTMALGRVVTRTTSPFTLETQSFRWPGEQWMMEFTLPPIMNRAIASEWISFGLKLKGSFNYFLLGDPSAKTPQGVATGTPLVSVGSQTGNTLNTKGWTPSTSNILMAGDYIQLGTGTAAHLHLVVENATSDGSGNAALSIEPALRESPLLNQAVIINEPKGLFRLSDNNFSWPVVPGPRYDLSFSAVEVVSA